MDEYCRYKNSIPAEDFKKIASVLKDLGSLDVPIDKAIKEYKIDKSDWDTALGL